MIFLEHYQTIKSELIVKKQEELLQKVKKEYIYTDAKLETLDKPRLITDVKIGQEGSIEVTLDNDTHPIYGYPDKDSVMMVAIYKKLVPNLINSILAQKWHQRFITLLALKYNFDKIVPSWFETIFNTKQVLLKDECWQRPVKELRRVLLKHKMDWRLVNAIALVLEYDSAYRYRFQDIMAEYNKEAGIVKELERLLDLLASRDYAGMDIKWGKFKKFVKLLHILPKTKKLVKSILDDFDIEKVRMDKNEIYWTNQFSTYNYRGLPLEERLKLNSGETHGNI